MTALICAPTLDDALSALAERIAENEARGENNFVFCEDRLTLLAERAVLARSGGTFRTEVSTLARYLSGAGRVLSKQGSVMAVSSILSACEKELRCFRPGAAEAVYETLAQLLSSRVGASELSESAAQAEGILREKLTDLSLILERYRAFLQGRGLLDESAYLALLPEKIASGGLRAANVFFFAFPSFTRQAAEGVRAAMRAARSVTGIFLSGDAALYTNEGARVFRAIAAEEGGVRSVRTGCSLGGEALALHDALFSPEALPSAPLPAKCVHIFRPADEAEEADAVAALIRRSVAEGARYRDMAVLVPDEESFLAVGKAFSAYRIPYFADMRRPFSGHPFCAFAIAALEAAADGGLPASVDAIAANVCFGEGGDAYRNYLYKYGGYRGAVQRPIREEAAGDAAFLCACRERMLAILKLFPAKGRGARFVSGVRALAELCGAARVCEDLAQCFDGAERAFLSLDPLEGLLAETEEVAGESVLTAREFCALFRSGTEALKIAMIPNAADAVFVGDATESRFARVHTVFAMGQTDALPRTSADTAVVTDGDIKKLAALRVEVEPTIAAVNARAREGLALNVCAFSGALYLSRPLRRRGQETAEGELMTYAARLFSPAPMPDLFLYRCCEPGPAALTLLALKEAFETGREEDSRPFASLYAALAARGRGEEMRALFAGDERPRVAEAGALYFRHGDISPTLLERYFACPYAGFLKNALRLREREERAVLARDTGDFVHEVLDRTANAFSSFADEAACRRFAEDAGRALLREPRYAVLGDTAPGSYTAERLLGESVEIAAAAYRHLNGSAYRVRATEAPVAIPEIFLRGKADRVDAAGDYVRVIDYKTGRFDDTPAAYYTGRSLQLPLYLFAASRGGEAAGAFYFPAEEKFTKPDEGKYRLKGFFRREDDVLALMDAVRGEGGESALFEGGSGRGMEKEEFDAFLSYALLVSRRAEEEMRAGNIGPSPYEGECAYCAYRGACGFTGAERKESGVKCADVARIAREEGEQR